VAKFLTDSFGVTNKILEREVHKPTFADLEFHQSNSAVVRDAENEGPTGSSTDLPSRATDFVGGGRYVASLVFCCGKHRRAAVIWWVRPCDVAEDSCFTTRACAYRTGPAPVSEVTSLLPSMRTISPAWGRKSSTTSRSEPQRTLKATMSN